MDGNFRGYVFEIFALLGSFKSPPSITQRADTVNSLELLYLKTPSEGRSKVLDSS